MAARIEAANSAVPLQVMDLRRISARQMDPLLEEERAEWAELLEWDFEKSADLVRRFVDMHALNGFALLLQLEPDFEVLQALLIPVILLDHFAQPSPLLQRLLSLLLVLPEVLCVDYFFKRNQFLLLVFDVKDNLEDEIPFLSLPHTTV